MSGEAKKMDNSGATGSLASVAEIIAVVAAAAIAYLGYKIYENKKSSSSSSSTFHDENVPSQPSEIPVRFAAAVKTHQYQNEGSSPEAAASLFSNASLRWAGPETKWSENIERMGISHLNECPTGDGDYMIVTFKSSLPKSEIPVDRYAMRSYLGEAAAKGKLTFSGLYDYPLSLNLTRFGFEEG